MDKIPRPRATVPALRWQRVTYPLTRNFPRPRSLSNALRRRRPSASGSSTPPCVTPAPSARATRTSSRTAVSRAARRSKPVGSPARRQRAPVASGSSREDSSVRSRALGRTREPPARLVDVNEMNPFRLYPGVRSSPSASRARFDATRERLALSSRRENRENCVLRFMRGILVQVRQSSKHNATAGGCGADARGAFLRTSPVRLFTPPARQDANAKNVSRGSVSFTSPLHPPRG